MKKLEPGLVKSKELAEWFGISYTAFRASKAKKLQILSDYCDFEEVYGGLNIKKVYFDTYSKAINYNMDKMYLMALCQKTEAPIISCSGTTYECFPDESHDNKFVNRVSKQFAKSRDHLFGKPTKGEGCDKWSAGGLVGRCRKVIAVKLNGTNNYRYLFAQEWDYLVELYDNCSSKQTKIIEDLDFTSRSEDYDSNEVEENKRNRYKEKILEPFFEKFGYWLVVLPEHEITEDFCIVPEEEALYKKTLVRDVAKEIE